MNSKTIIFGTGTPRSGGTLISNMLSVHKDIIITTDFIHFFRHIFNFYNPLYKKENQYKLVQELCLRVKYRKNEIFSSKEILSNFINIKNYNDILIILSEFILSKTENKSIFGEYANTEWRNIENFLNLEKNYKAFQVIRDPRAMLVSWKKLTYATGYKYLNILFNWIDAFNYSETYKKKFTTDKYLRIKFENIHEDPKKMAEKLCNFIEVKFDKSMISGEKWPKLLMGKFTNVNVSSYSNKNSYGFSVDRTTNWQQHIEDWEVALVQFLFKDQLKILNYKLLDIDKNLIKKALKIIEQDEILSKNFNSFKKDGRGTDKHLNDPKNPENWAARDTSKSISAKFSETEDYKMYLSELKKIQEISKTIE